MNNTIRIEFAQEQHGSENRTIARITVPSIPSLTCDLWCYEDKFGVGEGDSQDDGSMILKHRHAEKPEVELRTHLIPSSETVVSLATITGPDERAVRSIRALNACWQFRPSNSFGNRGHFVRDFVNRCFLYTSKGFQWLTDTQRYPDTRRGPDDEKNSPPWVQRYCPLWEEHPGQPQAGWGVSSDRPAYSLVGAVSRDGKHLAAWGTRQCIGIGQGWHDCLHLLADLQLDYDTQRNQIVSRNVFYFTENDPVALLERYKSDFNPVEGQNTRGG